MNRSISERAIIFAPRGRDAEVAGAMLRDAGMESEVARDLDGLVELLRGGAGFVVVTDEAFRNADLRPLRRFIQGQEEWSDFPFVLLTERGGGLERNPAAGRHLDLLGNVTFLERPFHPTTLVSLARAALRARRRQYEARARLQAIREAEQQLRIALAAGKLGAWRLDVPTMTLSASAECKAQFGRSPDEGFTYADLIASVHDDDRPKMRSAVEDALANGVDYDVEHRCVWPNGSVHWVQVRGRPEFDSADRPLRMIGVSLDTTERRAAEEALRSFASELERRVEERTRERESIYAQLHEVQKLETLGQLTGGVAHDFNNLLTPIVGSLDMARRKSADPRLSRVLDGGLQSAERARLLVTRLLSFARRQNLEARPIDVGGLIDGMSDLIRKSVGPTVLVSIDVPVSAPPALVDPNQLELALLNLAINSRDAMPEGGRLSIAAQERRVDEANDQLKPGVYVQVSVADTGAGMDAATLARSIEPFYSTKGVGRGTGLGLSMVHGLAAQSGGCLSLVSEVGAGTTAELWLPAAPAAAAVAHRPVHDDEVGTIAQLKVLLVDDEAIVRQGTASMLQELGHEVAEAESAALALDLVRSRPFDVVVTDYLMPGMSGLELARELRKMRTNLPVLMITGFADLAEGAASDVARLAKPFRVGELARAVQEVSVAAC